MSCKKCSYFYVVLTSIYYMTEGTFELWICDSCGHKEEIKSDKKFKGVR